MPGSMGGGRKPAPVGHGRTAPGASRLPDHPPIFAGTFHFLDAKVCAAGQLQISGVFIGETSERVYIGQSSQRADGPRRVVSIPLSRVEELFIGGEAAAESCRE